MADNVSTVAGIYEAFGRGDVAWIVERLDDDISWEEGIRDTGLSYLEPGRGKQHVADFFGHLMSTLELTHFEPEALCDGGDVVMVPVLHAGRIVGGGEVPLTHEAHEWRFGPDGKVVAFRHLFDYAIHERAAGVRNAALTGRTLRAVGEEVEVLSSGGALEVFHVTGAAESGPPPHSHPWQEAYIGVRGDVEVTIGDAVTTLRPGDFVAAPAGATHSFRVLSESASFHLITSGHRASAFFADLDEHVAPGPVTPDSLPSLVEVARRHGLALPSFA
jgi:quercetin dioxygenase-like cupin family protein/ketosteroid isomerase-like protein